MSRHQGPGKRWATKGDTQRLKRLGEKGRRGLRLTVEGRAARYWTDMLGEGRGEYLGGVSGLSEGCWRRGRVWSNQRGCRVGGRGLGVMEGRGTQTLEGGGNQRDSQGLGLVAGLG